MTDSKEHMPVIDHSLMHNNGMSKILGKRQKLSKAKTTQGSKTNSKKRNHVHNEQSNSLNKSNQKEKQNIIIKPGKNKESTSEESKDDSLKISTQKTDVFVKKELPPRAKRGALMPTLIWQAQEDKDLFWYAEGFESSEGELDEDFNSKEVSHSLKEDSFDSDFTQKGKSKIKRAKGYKQEKKLIEKL